MPLQNRVTPFGELIADPARGLVYGNRGCLHDDAGAIRRHFAGKRWIACRLRFRGWHRAPLLQPGRFTELFFLDEATAFAAGHRPCALCRREDYARFAVIFRRLHPGTLGAGTMDARLHRERFDASTRRQRHHLAPFDSLPDGTIVVHDDLSQVVVRDSLLRWTPAGYVEPRARPRVRSAVVVTPPSMVEVLRAGDGWEPAVPLLHPSAEAGRFVPSPTAR